MKYITSKHSVGLLLSMLLVACGGGGGDSTSTGTSPVSATPASPTVSTPAPTTATVTEPVTAPVTAPVTVPAPEPAPALKYPIPASLWAAPPNATPATGNYIYMKSDAGDFIGGGGTYGYTDTNAVLTLTTSALGLSVSVNGDQRWDGSFQLPRAASNLQAGFFGNLTRTPFADPTVGGIQWTGEGRGCNDMNGWVAVDKVELKDNVLSAVDLRFEQHCDGNAPALRGQIHWTRANASSALGPGAVPIPSGLWQPTSGMTPATGNYMYLESSSSDYIGAGRTYLYTPANTTLKVTTTGNRLDVGIAGDEDWDGQFQGMGSMQQLGVGYYGNLKRYPFHNPVVGGLNWSGEGRGCNTLNGWFAVDKISYDGSTLVEIDLRFEQHCEGNQAPLRGKLHWKAGDTTHSPGPTAIPANLWSPDASFVPPSGNYAYLVSDAGDYIGQGRTELLTPSDSTFNVVTNRTAALGITVGPWSGDFVAMNSLSQLQPGYYGNLQRYPFNNAVKGGLDWGGSGRGCNTLSGWFAVDRVVYSLGQLTAIDLRFEQHCEGFTPAQRGVIHWSK
jgi:hypothetical protein